MSEAQPAGNYYDKYGTRNPIARLLMNGYFRSFDALLQRCEGIDSAIEVGCGEGELSIRVARKVSRVTAVDVSPEVVEEARKRTTAAAAQVTLRAGSIYDLDAKHDAADLVICCEVMEHLEQPQQGLDKLHEICSRYLITSVPREPLWRVLNLMRGKYIAMAGNTPGHVQHWSQKTFLDFLARRFRVMEMRAPIPWTMALCVPLDKSSLRPECGQT